MDLKAIERRGRIKRQNRLGARHKKRGVAEAKPKGKVVSMQSTEVQAKGGKSPSAKG
ncbi:MAG: hypothetical protein AOA65_0573 [Candidatus Bathyarchaeota archaeon BA1]|nr:MAG: hypothetical protein AOA65_0573 [Candidatus Bathyarchaeota archaeon BA1]